MLASKQRALDSLTESNDVALREGNADGCTFGGRPGQSRWCMLVFILFFFLSSLLFLVVCSLLIFPCTLAEESSGRDWGRFVGRDGLGDRTWQGRRLCRYVCMYRDEGVKGGQKK